MFNITQIQAAFSNLVGFNQTNDPTLPTIESSLCTPITGKFLSQPLCTTENIFNICPDFAGFDNLQSDEDVAESFNNWLRNDIYKKACANLLSWMLETKKINYEAKSLLDSQQLYTGFGFMGDKIISQSRFVGFQINVLKKQNLSVAISRLGFQIDTAQTVTFYLYHTSQVEPIQTVEMVITRPSSFTWKDDLVDVVMGYMPGNINSAGSFIFGYYEDDIIGQVIKMDKNLNTQPCATCSYTDINYYNAWSKYVSFQAIEVPASGINEDRELFDLSKMVNSSNTNYGMNMALTATCDLTQFFITNRMLFTNALAQQMCLELVNKMAYTTRLNEVASSIKALAMADLDVSDPSSYISEVNKSRSALNVDFSGFDADCLPCRRNSGLSIGAI